jgi:hypothetical protein
MAQLVVTQRSWAPNKCLPQKSLFHLRLLRENFRGWFVSHSGANLFHLCFAKLVVVKAGRFPQIYHKPSTRTKEVSRGTQGGGRRAQEVVKQKAKRRNGSVRTHYKYVNVEFTRTAFPRLVAPASPIWFPSRLKGSPKQTTSTPRGKKKLVCEVVEREQ